MVILVDSFKDRIRLMGHNILSLVIKVLSDGDTSDGTQYLMSCNNSPFGGFISRCAYF